MFHAGSCRNGWWYIGGVVHAGHIRLFRHAREICDYLIVGILPDSSAEDIFLPAHDRVDGVRANTLVNDAFILSASPVDTIKKLLVSIWRVVVPPSVRAKISQNPIVAKISQFA